VRDAGRPGIAACAISALDIALWDLKARLLELPLARLLGVARERVPVYGSGGFTTYHDRHLAAQLNGWVHGQHIPRVKMKIGESEGRAVARDLARVRAARQVVGEAAEPYVDAGGAYTRKQAVRVGQALAEHGVSWFEEPVASGRPRRAAAGPRQCGLRCDGRGARLRPAVLRPADRGRRGRLSRGAHPAALVQQLAAQRLVV